MSEDRGITPHVIKQMLEYRESLYEQLTAINGILGDETYTRINYSSAHEDKYGVKKNFYVYCNAEPILEPTATYLK